MNAGLAEQLWIDNAGLAAQILEHPFVRGIAGGTLQVESFKRYVAQDAYFLEAFARAYARCLADSTERPDLIAFSRLIAGVIGELELHAAYARRWAVDLAGVVPTAATAAYTGFLERCAREGNIGATVAAMTPCMRLYAWLGQTLATTHVAPLYAEWVTTYASAEFEALAMILERLLDRHGLQAQIAAANYRRAMQLELEFFAANL